jgi:Domain of unknown function (DUF4148)
MRRSNRHAVRSSEPSPKEIIMKTSANLFVSTLVVAIAGFASAAAFAQEVTPAPEMSSFVSQKTRAEVRAELQQAIAAQRIARTDVQEQRLEVVGFVATKSRAQVAAETRAAARLGLISRNDIDYPLATPTAEQQHLVEQAGERARGTQFASR